MKLIVGLGNPGKKYEQTRHNIGFVVAAKVAAILGVGPSRGRFEGEVAEGNLTRHAGNSEKLVILWPQTFMNASGQSVRKACDFYKLPLADLLVITDDMNLKTGRVRLRPSGSAGGQKGLADIIRHLQSEDFARLRIGIDRPPQNWTTTNYVLGKFSDQENDKLEAALGRAAEAAICWANDGIGPAMSRFNADPDNQTANPNPKPADPGGTTTETTRTDTAFPDPTKFESQSD